MHSVPWLSNERERECVPFSKGQLIDHRVYVVGVYVLDARYSSVHVSPGDAVSVLVGCSTWGVVDEPW